MRISKLGNLTGLFGRRAACAALAAAAIAAPANAYSIRICATGDGWGIWVEIIWANTSGNYDPATHAGLIEYNTMGPFNPDDFYFLGIPDGQGGVVDLHGEQHMVMGAYEVLDGLGTAQCTVSWPNIWLIIGDWGLHLINSPVPFLATLPLDGFTADGEGHYFASGLNIPVDFEVTRPDGTTTVVHRTVQNMELRTPLDLTPPPCLADLDGNGILDLQDINRFVQSFLAGCP
ncbi:MAG: hypothetical protein H6810_02810 [Phycisphaeraceae bacterium]|nr:MAG: hypothetical protein H6810_02810 [Phycisphaeraceae bacterium]